MNRANPVYFTYRLNDGNVLVACWSWHRRYLAKELPDRWELHEKDQPSGLEEQCVQSGYRPLLTTESNKQAIWEQICKSQTSPKRTPKQQAKFEAREARKREHEQNQAEWLQKLGKQREVFTQVFSGLDTDSIRRKYRQLAREHHPDVGGSSDNFRMLEAAYRKAIQLSRH